MTRPQLDSTRAVVAAAIALAALAAYAFLPALQGGFLFDDFANLPALGRYGPITDWPSLLRYATSGIADPTGRPVSMLSFLIDARNWPADPYSFKRTNLLVHLLNGVLLASVLLQSGRRIPLDEVHARAAALLGAALWCLHPLWVSTVAYVIQRHAMLPVTFVLIGIALWYRANDAFNAGLPRKGWLLALMSVVGCGLLAGLSKANGFLLPALLLVLQSTVLERPGGVQRSTQLPAPARLGLLWLPTAAIVLWLVWNGIWHWGDTLGRPWTVGQRLLTEPRVLVDYAWRLLRPAVHSRGLFADDFIVSTSLLSPLSSMPALIALLASVAAAWWNRHRQPAVSVGILFFLCGHLVESTSYPLELYFEHRNYLPALFLGWPLAIWLTAPGKWFAGRSATAIVLLGMLALITHARASLWGDPQRLGISWAEHFPASARAQAYAAALELDDGHAEMAVARLRPRLDTTEVQFALNLIDAECAIGSVRPATLTAAESAIEQSGVGKDMVHHWLRDKLEAPAPACEGLDRAYERLVAAARRHPNPEPMESNRLSQLSGLLELHRGHCRNALESFNDGLRFERHAGQVFGQAGILATRCGAATALPHIVRYRMQPLGDDTPGKLGMPRIHQWVLLRQHYWESELSRLESLLRSEVTETRKAAQMGHVPQQ